MPSKDVDKLTNKEEKKERVMDRWKWIDGDGPTETTETEADI